MMHRKDLENGGVPDSKLPETSHIQSHMHFGDSVESIADSDLEEVSAQNTQADRKASVRSHPSEGPKASGKSDALFSSAHGNLIRSSNPSNLRGSLLQGNKDHLLNQGMIRPGEARTSCQIRQTEAQRLALQDAENGFVESRREQVRLQEDLSMKVLRNIQIRNMHEMFRSQRAQEFRVDEV